MSSFREQLEMKFIEEYNKLNPQQKSAVDHIEGPVMVIAGPGTGKTQILSARIAKILMDTDARPENILCLTYTDAGVVAMRKRLLSIIGADAYKVNIYTFHAFCNDVIQENLSLFEKNSLDPISDLERIELFKELIDAFPKDHPLKRYRSDVYFEIKNLQSLFSTMKREGWNPQFISQKIDDYIADLPTREEYVAKKATNEFKKGDVRTDKIAEEKERMEKLRAAACEFEKFQELMHNRNRYDFDDMINWVIKAFEDNKSLLLRYQEQYQYMLIDEYQDTSGTQNKLVSLLINYWDKPNVFVVGDDDQSIYRFQGANVENMLNFADFYKDHLLTVVLTNNYRSTQPILDISKTLIGNNNERLVSQINGLSKELLSANSRLQQFLHLPIIKEYETQRQEMMDITLQVQQLIAAGVAPGRIGIIYKENKYGEELTQYLKLHNIPFYSKRSLNVFDIPLAQKIILLFQYLAAEHDVPYGGDEMLFEILHFDWFCAPPLEIAKLSIEVSQSQFGNNKTSLRRLLNEKATQPPRDLFTPQLHQGLKTASRVIEKLIGDVPNVTIQTLFESIIRDAGVLSFIMKSAEKIWLFQVVNALFDFVKEETKRYPAMSLAQLVNVIGLMKKEKITLPLTQVSGSDKGVNLITVHGSKGLEFEHVFFVGCNATFWERKKSQGGGFSLPDTMFTSQPVQNDEEELRRLFYVALTRAEQHLSISYNRLKNDGKELEPSQFIAEIQEVHALPVQKVYVGDDVLAAFSILQFGESSQPEISKMEEDFVSNLLDKFVMNVTALSNYLSCPLRFYFQNLARVPSGKSEATEFGSSVHHALQRLFEKMQHDPANNFPSKEAFISDFEWYMRRHRENFTLEQFARRMEYGQTVLANYYDAYMYTFNKIVAIERNIRNVTVQGIPIKGKIDKLEFDGRSVNVVDYKTGDFDKAKTKLQPPNEKDPNGGDYWRQAVFYKILIDNYQQKQWNVVSTEFDFVEPDKKKNYRREKVVIQPQDITTVTQQIVTVWNKIQQRDFYTGCGKEDCHWCNFVKNNQMAVALHEANEKDS
jgi:DNA helicase-2/ATP-dependent DNA helicase PcrA